MSPKPTDAWEFWRKASEALGELCAVMAEFECAIMQDDPTLQLPPHAVKEAKRALARFQENFACMVREQKKKGRPLMASIRGDNTQRVADFNSKHPAGSSVCWRKANGEIVEADIRSAAEVRRGVGAVVWLVGIAGPKSLDRITDDKAGR